VTSDEFWVRFPNYASTSLELVEAALAEAGRGISASVYGDRYDDAQGLRAAHILWVSPFGTTTRLDGDKDPEIRSRYWELFTAIRREVSPRMMVL